MMNFKYPSASNKTYQQFKVQLLQGKMYILKKSNKFNN